VTIRDKKIDNAAIVYAGPAAELAALALKYAAGALGTATANQRRHFEAVAALLATGCYPAEQVDGIRFWCDRPDGTPFQGPSGYRPDPDEDWLAANSKA
jgi:hypothetical protein